MKPQWPVWWNALPEEEIGRPRSLACLRDDVLNAAPELRSLALAHQWGISLWARWRQTPRRTWPRWRSWGWLSLAARGTAAWTASCRPETWTCWNKDVSESHPHFRRVLSSLSCFQSHMPMDSLRNLSFLWIRLLSIFERLIFYIIDVVWDNYLKLLMKFRGILLIGACEIRLEDFNYTITSYIESFTGCKLNVN